MNLVSRKEVPEALKWDLSLLFKNEKALQEAMGQMSDLAESLVCEYKGKLNTAEQIVQCLMRYGAFLELCGKVVEYAELAASVDYGDAFLQEQNGNVQQLSATLSGKLSFIESEIAACGADVLQQAMKLAGKNACYLEGIIREIPHKLNPETEAALANLMPVFDAPFEIYNAAKLADLAFEPFVVDGEQYDLGYSLFEDDYEYNANTAVRRAAFDSFSKQVKKYENVTATAYNTLVQYEKTMAILRGFPSVIDYLLFPQQVERSMYNRQIDLIMDKLAPHMRKYAKLLKAVHHLDRMTYADLKLPLDPEYNPTITIEEAQTYVEQGLAVMGADYVDMVRRGFRERWIDFARNQGKSTGGFCSTPYGSNAFILLSWNDRMSDVFTLAHEFGHAGHFEICGKEQSIFGTEISLYFLEAPSTINELLLMRYMLKSNPDKRFRRWVLSNLIGNTYYHNFVTHLLEAAYQREVYKLVDAGESLSAKTLSDIYQEVLTKFWGDAVELTEGAELTWMRQPHYYCGLYSYTYSAGLTIATAVSDRIEREGEHAVSDWKKVLATGSTKTPVELAKMAGVDITTDAALEKTIEIIGQMIDEICELSEEDLK